MQKVGNKQTASLFGPTLLLPLHKGRTRRLVKIFLEVGHTGNLNFFELTCGTFRKETGCVTLMPTHTDCNVAAGAPAQVDQYAKLVY